MWSIHLLHIESSEGVEKDTEIRTDQITLYEGELFPSSYDNGKVHEEDDEEDEDVLTAASLEW